MKKVIIEKLSREEIEKRGIEAWPIWEKEISRFDWEYIGDEECLILEGRVIVETDEGEYDINPGDFVTFKDGLTCIWDIKEGIRKHYNFK